MKKNLLSAITVELEYVTLIATINYLMILYPVKIGSVMNVG